MSSWIIKELRRECAALQRSRVRKPLTTMRNILILARRYAPHYSSAGQGTPRALRFDARAASAGAIRKMDALADYSPRAASPTRDALQGYRRDRIPFALPDLQPASRMRCNEPHAALGRVESVPERLPIAAPHPVTHDQYRSSASGGCDASPCRSALSAVVWEPTLPAPAFPARACRKHAVHRAARTHTTHLKNAARAYMTRRV